MPRLHISQDDTGFWQLSLEADNGEMRLLSHQFESPDHLIEDARELVADGVVPNAVILIAPPRPHSGPILESVAQDYKRPAPRKAV